MDLTPTQKATVKTWLTANAQNQSDDAAAALLNANAAPDYWAWKTSTDRGEIYERTVPTADSSTGAPTTWSWQGFKVQSVQEQGCWLEMFVTGGNFSLVNNRVGVENIFGGSGLSGLNRIHIFNAVRRRITVFEKLFSAAVISPPANTGNDGIAGNRGKVSNPDLFGLDSVSSPIQGQISGQQVSDIRNS